MDREQVDAIVRLVDDGRVLEGAVVECGVHAAQHERPPSGLILLRHTAALHAEDGRDSGSSDHRIEEGGPVFLTGQCETHAHDAPIRQPHGILVATAQHARSIGHSPKVRLPGGKASDDDPEARARGANEPAAAVRHFLPIRVHMACARRASTAARRGWGEAHRLLDWNVQVLIAGAYGLHGNGEVRRTGVDDDLEGLSAHQDVDCVIRPHIAL
mmetsp:Transcript_83226/g.254438  ORF Transcript_83226/g.254438 Transcript_83226/m.254438 type:complete len:214 (+) Transcript_83226:832-1473(+)